MSETAPEGFQLVATDELERLRAVDAKHGWKERPVTPEPPHNFVPHKKHVWFCQLCAYGPGDAIKHLQPGQPGFNAYAGA